MSKGQSREGGGRDSSEAAAKSNWKRVDESGYWGNGQIQKSQRMYRRRIHRTRMRGKEYGKNQAEVTFMVLA